MGGMRRRVSALEDGHVERLVEERLQQEIGYVLERLERALTEEEFVRVLRIVAREESSGH